MLILTIRTDKPEAEIGLYRDSEQLSYVTWLAHRQLAETIHERIRTMLQNQTQDWPDIGAVCVFSGPGSFTGLRIGITVANTLAFSLAVPIVAETGADWLEAGIQRLLEGSSDEMVTPEYGALPNITVQKK